jgi:transcriptional regulator with XRE-family HTH domain
MKLGQSKKYREAFAASVVKRVVPAQIRVLRRQRQWSQAQLAKESDLTQGVISRAEDPDYGNLTLNTLVRIAAGFDCAYIGRFVPFSDLGKWYSTLDDERHLEVQSFNDDAGFIERKEVVSAPAATTTLSVASAYPANVSGGSLAVIRGATWSERKPRTEVFTMPRRTEITETKYRALSYARRKRTARAAATS